MTIRCPLHRFDHDCPWVSNTVGHDNHLVFLMYCFWAFACNLSFVVLSAKWLVRTALLSLPCDTLPRYEWPMVCRFVFASTVRCDCNAIVYMAIVDCRQA